MASWHAVRNSQSGDPEQDTATPGGRTDWQLYRRLWPFLSPYSRVLTLAVVLNVVGVGAALVEPLLLKTGIDDHVATGDLQGLSGVVALFIVVIVLGFSARAGALFLMLNVGLKTLAALRRGIFVHVMGQGQRFFDRRTTGSLLTRTTSDVEAVYESLAFGAVNLITDALTIVGILGAMLLLDWKLTLVAFAMAPLLVVIVDVFRRKLRVLSLVIRKTLSRLNGFFAEAIYGMTILQLYGADRRARRQFREISYRYLDAYRASNWWDAGLYAVMDGMGSLAIGLMLWYGAAQFGEPGSGVTLGLLVAFIDYLGRIFGPIRDFSGRLAAVQRAVAAIERIVGLLDTRDQVSEGELPMKEVRGEVVFEDVDFAYGEDRPKVLDGVSFSLQPGEVVALVGATGAGKTTIGKVMTRVYDGYRGSIRIDGIELSDLCLDDLRRNVVVVHQDVYLFDGSIAENIALWGGDVDRERLELAAQRSRAASFIETLPARYEHHVRERGSNLSAGQKQLLAIARGMARDAPIVILDEATASVDSVTEGLVDEAIAELFASKTVLVIAHRLSTIMKADRIVVLHGGRVVEHGTHEELLAQDGCYKVLVETGFAI